MIIRHVKIINFRGIRSLDWHIPIRFVVLVGPGDSGKTSVFEAIDVALGRQWYTPTDADFLDGNPANQILIEVTVGELPEKFFHYHGYGTCLRGWAAGVLHDEPQHGDEEVVTVRLHIDASLDPTWTLVSNRDPEGVPIRGRDRSKLGLHRLGTNVDHQLGWGRGSLLTRKSEAADDLHSVFAGVARKIRQETHTEGISGITDVIANTQRIADEIGVDITGLKAAINASDLSLGSTLLALHQADVPVKQMGLGSRRLLAIGLEMDAVAHDGIALVDEIEHGLEPYRIHTLMQRMRRLADGSHGQAFLTTHAATVICDCTVTDLHIVRNHHGAMTITQVPDTNDMRMLVRTAPEALLSRRVITCEGRTEYGMCRGLDAAWTATGKKSLAAKCCVPVEAKGNCAGSGMSRDLHSLGYQVCFFGDSDVDVNPTWTELAQIGITVIRWREPNASEHAVFTSLAWSDLMALLAEVPQADEPSYFGTIAANAHVTGANNWTAPLVTWQDSLALRSALAAMAKRAAWIKNIDMGDRIGRMAVVGMPATSLADDFRTTLERLRTWIDAA
ncbi:MAG: AAA family ATPase [Planctomycetes bacterium]|nr:AAA family ATPase [Planctomycetota bacterium]